MLELSEDEYEPDPKRVLPFLLCILCSLYCPQHCTSSKEDGRTTQPPAKWPQGRPPKNPSAAVENANEPPVPKRGRGRPPKERNESRTQSDGEPSEHTPNDAVPRKRGRPRKIYTFGQRSSGPFRVQAVRIYFLLAPTGDLLPYSLDRIGLHPR
ncbi:hypothetical protein BDZ89DRAFT_376884 [Hymenopellis radicata]|nr:hypothetical protein BDZ89DRAFT_376884 [Hymenopellis radicata]